MVADVARDTILLTYYLVQARVGDARMATAFVALQGTAAENGGLEVWPRSHRCAPYPSEGWEPVLLQLGPGDAVIIDSRLWHRGGLHEGREPRAVVYASCAAPPAGAARSGDEPTLPIGATYALHPGLWGRRLPLRLAGDGEEQGGGGVPGWTAADQLRSTVEGCLDHGDEPPPCGPTMGRRRCLELEWRCLAQNSVGFALQYMRAGGV